MTECRPPPGTPDGTVCLLACPSGPHGFPWVWDNGEWLMQHRPSWRFWPSVLSQYGWRFHSIATPPALSQGGILGATTFPTTMSQDEVDALRRKIGTP